MNRSMSRGGQQSTASHRQPRAHAEPGAVPRAGGKLAAEHGHAGPHAGQAVTARGVTARTASTVAAAGIHGPFGINRRAPEGTVSRNPAVTVVGDLDDQLRVGVVRADDRGGTGAAVLHGVGERLLDDAVGGELDAVGERTDRPGDPQLDGSPGVADPGGQGGQVAEAGLRGEFGFGAGRAADDTEQAAGLGQGAAPGRDDRIQRLGGFGGPAAT